VATVVGLTVLAAGLLLILPTVGVPGLPNLLEKAVGKPPAPPDQGSLGVDLVPGRPDTFDLRPDAVKRLKVPPAVPVAERATDRRLEMPGSLAFDPNYLGRIQSRFPGEVVALGVNEEPTPTAQGRTEPERPLRYGDRVRKGQLMAVVWSKDLGEKKSELIDTLVRVALDQQTVTGLEKLLREGATSEAVVRQARNVLSTDLSAVARIRRTLLIWRVEQQEVEAVEKEARRIIASKRLADLPSYKQDRANVEKWARVEIFAPFDGVIVEKNLTVGNMADTTFDLYKIADMRRLAAYANAYEEDLKTLEDLQARSRPRLVPWRVYLAADPARAELKSPGIERVGYIVDPQQHTNVVIGQVDNADGRLRVGQFVTAVVDIPPPPGVVSVPVSALVEDGSESVLFVQPEANRHRYVLKRVVVTQRFQEHAYVRSRLGEAEKKAGLSELRPGERVVPGAAVALKAALEEAQSKAK
jgi:cobalt-zinc-cadmium efflux system membrane fusion protein